jgi:hypothetical protein
VDPDEVDCGGGEGVFEGDFVQAGVAGLADAGERGDLVNGAFDPGAGAVGVLPGVGLLFGAGVAQCFVQVPGAGASIAGGVVVSGCSRRGPGRMMQAQGGKLTTMMSWPSWRPGFQVADPLNPRVVGSSPTRRAMNDLQEHRSQDHLQVDVSRL